MTPAEAAAIIKHWAINGGLVNRNRPIECEEVNDATAHSLVASTVNPLLELVRTKGFNYVLFNDALREVVVVTERSIPSKIRKTLPSVINQTDIKVRFIEGGVAQAGGPVPPPHPSARFTLKNGTHYCCGSSISMGNVVEAGTLGALVKNSAGEIYGLSNNHVTGGSNYAEIDLPIIAPGTLDVCAAAIDPFCIGRHKQVMPMSPGHPSNVPFTENVDAAIFRIADPSRVSSFQGAFYDTPSLVADVTGAFKVEKVGRTTGLTSGVVQGWISGPEPVTYSISRPSFQQEVYYKTFIVVKGDNGKMFSEGGDSGSLVTTVLHDGSRAAIGLVFAGNAKRGFSYVLPLAPILSTFGVSMVSNHNA